MDTTPLSISTIINNSTIIAAWFGGVVSFFLLLFEVYKYWKDKGSLKITVNFEQEIIGQNNDGKLVNVEPGNTFWYVSLNNVGTKDVRFSQLAFSFNRHKKKGLKHGILSIDYFGKIEQCTIKPGTARTFTVDYRLVHPMTVKTVTAIDAVGNKFRKRIRFGLWKLFHR